MSLWGLVKTERNISLKEAANVVSTEKKTSIMRRVRSGQFSKVMLQDTYSV